MKNPTYKGYRGKITIDFESNILYGRVLDVQDVITFQGTTPEETLQAFRDSVDDYLEFCAELGQAPEKPYSGKFVLRLPPELHRRSAALAESRDISLNQWIIEIIEQALENESAGSGRKPDKTGNEYSADSAPIEQDAIPLSGKRKEFLLSQVVIDTEGQFINGR